MMEAYIFSSDFYQITSTRYVQRSMLRPTDTLILKKDVLARAVYFSNEFPIVIEISWEI